MKAIILAVALAGAVGMAQGDDPAGTGHDATVHHDFKNAKEWAEKFDSPDRAEWQKSRIVMRVLGVAEGETVADIGAGTGYFTQILSRALGPTGKVLAVDIEPEMLAYIEQRDDLGTTPVETILARADDPLLGENRVDLALLVNTWHHIDDRLSYLERLRVALKAGGRVAVIDWHEGELPIGPPVGSKLSRAEVVAEFAERNWRLESESVALPYQYLLVFYPPE
ncbi:MAG TPA: methyltransferase [Candidatus Polarisedimenticolaceae bacterium]|nr:methyltransferase [Candidatus Polarisedimenticolaceae bacterium]